MIAPYDDPKLPEPPPHAPASDVPSWSVGLCAVAAVASWAFALLLFSNR
jgi:hypothetical protein